MVDVDGVGGHLPDESFRWLAELRGLGVGYVKHFE